MPVILTEKPSTLAPVLPEKPPQAAKHLCFDIETGNASKEAIELVQEFAKAPANIKDDTKAAAALDAKRAKIEDKSALLDAAPISCVTFVTENQQAVFYHRGTPWPSKVKTVKDLKGCSGDIDCFKNERELLVGIRSWLDKRAMPASMLIGHNVFGFDLPKLRSAYIRYRLVLPAVLRPEARDVGVEVYDIMPKFTKYFSVEKQGERYITLEEIEARLGLPSYKNRVSGAEIPRMVAAGQVREVLTYNYLDALSTYAAFLAMTGQYQDQEAH